VLPGIPARQYNAEPNPQEVFELGQNRVEANLAVVRKLGEKDYGTTDIPVVVAAIRKKPDERFRSADDLLTFSRSFLARAKQSTAADIIDRMPQQDVVIRPLAPFEEAAGVGSRFIQEPDPSKLAVYLIRLSQWPTQTRAEEGD
jgi:uncharacterized protein (DUF885 family)